MCIRVRAVHKQRCTMPLEHPNSICTLHVWWWPFQDVTNTMGSGHEDLTERQTKQAASPSHLCLLQPQMRHRRSHRDNPSHPEMLTSCPHTCCCRQPYGSCRNLRQSTSDAQPRCCLFWSWSHRQRNERQFLGPGHLLVYTSATCNHRFPCSTAMHCRWQHCHRSLCQRPCSGSRPSS